MATVAVQKALPVGRRIDNLFSLKRKLAEANQVVSDIKVAITVAEEELLEVMEAEGLPKASGKDGTVSIRTSVVANVTDWDALYPYISRTKAWHLLQRRVSDPAYRELLELGKKVPGVEPFNKRTLSVTTTK